MQKHTKIFEAVSKFSKIEQMALLLSRKDYDRAMEDFVQNIIKQENVDWNYLLGLLINHRVNGVVCNRIQVMEEVPLTVKHSLRFMLFAQVQRNACQKKEISQVFDELEREGVNYAFLKGAILNSFYYCEGERISNDTDILVNINDLDKAIKICEKWGGIQGHIEGEKIVSATKKEIMFAQLNTYETIPIIKKTENSYLPFHIFDINFRLGNDDKREMTKIMLKDTEIVGNSSFMLRTMSLEKFLIYLCIHLYREAVMVYKIVKGNDLLLYKFMDIHYFIVSNKQKLSWERLLKETKTLGRQKDVYYALYFTEELYPETIEDNVLEAFNVIKKKYLNQYRGKDNSEEVYDWSLKFHERIFDSVSRIEEARKNIGRIGKSYNKIREELKK
ncbi:MAG: nucleotidyltransferase family protein [Roseburia sp.]|nr:nucleotidyltransferase family protein [Roseburia sp.]